MALDTTVLSAAGLGVDTPAAKAVEGRAEIFRLTQAAEEAVLRPQDVGRWSHAFRAALAARIAELNGEAELAARYRADAGKFDALADPTKAAPEGDEAVAVAFMDKVAADTRNVAAVDISDLQRAGVADADIVRLAELNAFLAYQIRVIAGLRLMKEPSE